jgi:hypothetical protein
VNTCIICPNGVTASLGNDYVLEYDDNTSTCADLIAGALRFESGSDACALYDDKAFCCHPEPEETPTPTPSPTLSTSDPPPGFSSGVRSVPKFVELVLVSVFILVQCST